MTKTGYRHKEDEIDRLLVALGKVAKEKGDGAAMKMLPEPWRVHVDRLMDIRRAGLITATEIFIRTGLLVEREA